MVESQLSKCLPEVREDWRLCCGFQTFHLNLKAEATSTDNLVFHFIIDPAECCCMQGTKLLVCWYVWLHLAFAPAEELLKYH